MPIAEPPFTIGIEEEYLLVDRASRRLAEPPPALDRNLRGPASATWCGPNS